ncbi:MAG: hypothetical protein KJ057_04665 [Phycisphaerae bacterium]|nr:hypothetical protein [Planctomycetia bacterium]MCK6464077.1 hypothetical protein [Phycisphaerae bacterium]MCL4717750.1 hypothetical protein [Phycisphaerae bacterium]NUQ09363.1 hypothetical protein [Phycisphaerae bacterium]
MNAQLQQRVEAARETLDAHVRNIIAWHFDPKTGCPFWLEYADRLGWDPREHVHTYADLDLFPPFQDEWLRGGPVRRWVPKGLAHKPVYVFETGGSTGVPKTRINIDDFRIDYEMFSETLDDRYFPKGADWLMLGPSGPRRLRLAVEHLAQHRGGICFCVDLDPRWVTKLIKSGRMDLMHEYKDHVIHQALTILRAHPNIRCMFATPKLLEALCEKISLVQAGITGVFCGGTSMTAQFHRFAREELLEGGPDWWKPSRVRQEAGSATSAPGDTNANAECSMRTEERQSHDADHSPSRIPPSACPIDFVPTYGNTLMGLATHKPFDPADRYAVIYHPPHPRAVIEVVDPKSTESPDAWHIPPHGAGAANPGRGGERHRLVPYGEVGRVRLTTLTREFFMPRFLERDEAVRHPPCERYPWDGAGDVRPFSGFAVPIVEGVY